MGHHLALNPQSPRGCCLWGILMPTGEEAVPPTITFLGNVALQETLGFDGKE